MGIKLTAIIHSTFIALMVAVVGFHSSSFGAITETQYKEVWDDVHSAMRPYLDAKGYEVRRNGSSNTEFDIKVQLAKRPLSNDFYYIYVSKGALTEPFMSKEVLLHMLCHEFGHLLGGPPLSFSEDSTDQSKKEMAAEGQADFFSTSICVKQVLLKSEFKVQDLPPARIIKKCKEAYPPGSRDFQICIYSTVTSEKVTQIYKTALKKRHPEKTYKNPQLQGFSKYVAQHTLHRMKEYPDLQCRLDTLVAGAACVIDPNRLPEVFSINSQLGSQCRTSIYSNEPVEMRPKCWYNPNHMYQYKDIDRDPMVASLGGSDQQVMNKVFSPKQKN